MTLKEYVNQSQNEGKKVSYSSIARDVPCHVSLISKIANGDRTPSFQMARRIEQVTGSAVKRTNWYPDE
jgi:ribosome-binding protein aMBF1 (putative translation factor)